MHEDAAILRTVDAYFAALDRRDFAGVAACFTEEATASYDVSGDAPVRLVGAAAIAAWLHVVDRFVATSHARSSFVLHVKGDLATADVLATAHLVRADVDGGAVTVRGVRYLDRLRRSAPGDWRIADRRHQALWQYEVAAAKTALPG